MLFIVIITILYGLVPFLLFLFTKRWIKKNSIGPFALVVFIASLYEFIGSYLLEKNVELWFLIYDVMVFFSIHYYFYNLLQKKYNKLILKFICFSVPPFIALIFINLPYNFLEYSSFFNAFQTLIILFYSLFWFQKTFQEMEIENMLNNPNFYFISGLMIYYCGTIALFLLANEIYATEKSNFKYYWILNIILTLVLRTSLIIGIWKARRE